ncbi:MAG: ATP-dependent Clp protease proteolytic subunit [Acetobacteraceae bacterium]|nr:ATP-dependent Clp protease proteolytic subunit [Acetobacteraceae bacterium]
MQRPATSPAAHRRGRIALACLLLLLGFGSARSQPARPHVYVVPIGGVIDLGLAPFLARVLDEAATSGAAAVILDINTLGGRVDAAVAIRDTLLAARTPTVAFVNRRAISAGALIALATERIAMAEGGTIGAAMPVDIGGLGAMPQPVGEKTVSYVRKEFRATAEARKRPPLLAEAMVDADVEIPGVIEKGKLLTLTTDEALALKLADLRAADLPALLRALDIANPEIRRVTPSWAEILVRFLTHPTISSVLMIVGILGVFTEIRTPGFGFPGVIGLASIGLFFWGHWLVRLAGWEELLLVAAGVVLLVVEIFVTPGFGLVGLLGIAALLAGFTLSLVGGGATAEALLQASFQVILALLLAIAGMLVLFRFLPRLPFGRSFVLETGLAAGAGFTAPPAQDQQWLGRQGIAASVLRPAGMASFDDHRVDVVSEGEFIEAGTPIVVARVDGNRIVVRRVPARSTKE